MLVSEIKRNLLRPVIYNGSTYIFTGAIIRKRIKTDRNGKAGEFFYQAELQNPKCNKHITFANLELIEANVRGSG
ncbi:MAG: hypothetical protein ACI4Q8_02665 [Ruminococcus sp.]